MFVRMVSNPGGVDIFPLPNVYKLHPLINIVVDGMSKRPRKRKKKEHIIIPETPGESELVFKLRGSLKKLENMGIKPKLYTPSDNLAYLFIDLEDIAKVIDSKINEPNHRTYLEGKWLIIEVWG